MKQLSLNLRRVRSSVRTDVNTGVSVRKQQQACDIPSCFYTSLATGVQPPSPQIAGIR